MTDLAVHLYHRLPTSLATLVASSRGFYLRSWRYGPETERLVEEALDRDYWPAEKWRSWQQERLGAILHRAATHVPFYRAYWAGRRQRGDHASWDRLANWPLLDKQTVRAQPLAFLADDCNPRRMFHERTSGTTGTSLDLWWSRKTVRLWYAISEARLRRWYGVSRFDRWAILGGQLIVPVSRQLPPFWVLNAGLNQLYMSSYHLSPALIPHYLRALTAYGVKHLFGYPSALYELALGALRSDAAIPRLTVVGTNAEPLYPYQRMAIQQAFGCPVRDTYGMAELVAGGSECEHQSLHLWPEVGSVELSEGDRVDGIQSPTELVCTGLLNPDMPLIRYRVGDRALPSTARTPCGCGRDLPRLDGIEGRMDDVLVTRDGRRVGRLDPVFKRDFPIVEAQIIQDSVESIRVRYVPAPDYTDAAGERLTRALQARLGPVDVVLERTPVIPRTARGKFRAVICNIPSSAPV